MYVPGPPFTAVACLQRYQAGLFSAVSSAFVIAVQSKLEPDSGGRSEAYLRAIFLSLNRSTAPDEDPTTPPAWSGPPTEIVATSNLLCASLLMSLVAAFIAMLGKQWLNRYLRHTGGSMAERCGDRQRKFDGLEKWPFRLFVESLPVMLQLALLLLTCGLSRYMWSVNTSVACVVISFTVLGILFYVGIVVAGTSSYECPFQTPASIVLRGLSDSGTTQRLLASLSPPNVISLAHATCVNGRQWFISALHHAYGITQRLVSREISLSHITPDIRSMATKVGHRTIIVLLRIDRALGNARQRLVQGIQGFGHTGLLPTTTEDTGQQPDVPRNGPGLLVRVWDLEALRKQNIDNVCCVSWVLRNFTDPEAIDSAIRLAGAIRWFNGDPGQDPPFDLIVSAFEACFDSTKQLYPGMRDRAFFSARAILQISLRARAQSHECGSKYPVPEVSSNTSKFTDPDLHHVIRMLECNSHSDKPILDFPRAGANTHNHLLWTSNLFVDLTRVGPNPVLGSYESYLSAAITNHRATVANTLIMWYMFLGGHVEEETFWATDKSYVVNPFGQLSAAENIIYASDSLETILSHLSTRVMNAISDGDGLQHLNFLLEFLAAWEKRPPCLTPMAYEWCSAISEVAGRLGLGLGLRLGLRLALRLGFGLGFGLQPGLQLRLQPGLRLRLQPQDLASDSLVSEAAEREFAHAGPSCDPVRVDDASHHTHKYPREPIRFYHGILLSIILEVGFRLVVPGCDHAAFHLDHTPHHSLVFETIFSSRDDAVIADGVCAWIADRDNIPAGSCVHYLAKRVERDTPFSLRLRRMSIRAVERIWYRELTMSRLETVRLLNRLDVDLDDMGRKREWLKLLVDVIHSPVGLESLSIHYWRLLDRLVAAPNRFAAFASGDMGLTRSLEESEQWEKLEVWMVIAWKSLGYGFMEDTELGEGIDPGEDSESGEYTDSGEGTEPEEDVEPMDAEELEQVTLKLLLRRPSALPRFEDLANSRALWMDQDVVLRRICTQARVERSPPEPLPP